MYVHTYYVTCSCSIWLAFWANSLRLSEGDVISRLGGGKSLQLVLVVAPLPPPRRTGGQRAVGVVWGVMEAERAMASCNSSSVTASKYMQLHKYMYIPVSKLLSQAAAAWYSKPLRGVDKVLISKPVRLLCVGE